MMIKTKALFRSMPYRGVKLGRARYNRTYIMPQNTNFSLQTHLENKVTHVDHARDKRSNPVDKR